jgi:transcriptional regulator with XRE-family HTH domain
MKWADIKARSMRTKIARVRQLFEERRALTLRQLREEVEMTQAEMANLLEVTQSALSRMERREDGTIDALRRYVEALGGELEVVAILGDERVKILGL